MQLITQRASGGTIELPLSWVPCRSSELKKRTREIAEARVRYGYRRIHVLLRR
ncbi:hypothetical protein U1701_18180 [Sphingomonas sp. PB2P19]|uniref:hypothetical protein n=1 Tax=Sphingomonas rhamnosi TaxID=3096156 RepID=UPI002FC5B031